MYFSQEFRERWDNANKLVFRFLFAYFILYILLLIIQPFFEGPLRWFAENILHWGADFKRERTGSGDTTLDYVMLGFNITLAILMGTVWSFFDHRRASYNKAFYWFQATLRAFLCFTMLLYGFAKIFKGQFPDPSLVRLLQPLGDMSPMGLAWTFMGHSFFYSFFIGFAEILGGILLLSRKTLTLGSFIIIGVMGNVAMMNFTYDIPVKLFSVHLVLMALILFLADGKRMLNVFFKNSAVEKVSHYVPIKNTNFKKLISGTKMLVLALVAGIVLIQSFIRFEAREQLKTKPPFYGIWESQLFVLNNDTLPPLLTGSVQWRYLILDKKKVAIVKKMNDSLDRYQLEANTELHEILFRQESDSIPQRFSYTFVKPEHLELKGAFYGDSLFIQFKRKPESDFRLINRGFHWVNETPYNR